MRRTLERALAMVSEELDQSLNALLFEFEQELFRLADQARNPGVESGHMGTLRNFRVNRADLVPRFVLALEASLAGIRTAVPAPARQHADDAPSSAGFGALSLVDDAVMDEGTVLREIASRQEGRANLSLHLLGQRFGVLAGAPAFDSDRLPLGPQCLCRALASAARTLEIEHDARLLLYRIFDREVMSGYARILERLDAQLAEAGILPALTFVPMRVRASAPDDAAAPERRKAGPAPRPTAPPDPQRPYTAWAASAPATAEPDDEDHEAAYRTLQQLMSGRRELLRKFKPGTEARSNRPQLQTSDVSQALRQLQQQPLAPGKASRNLAEVRRSLLAQARQRDGEAATLAPQDEDAFELLGMLYGHIEDEIRSDAPAAALVRELQIPLLRAALQDHSFFTRKRHPARQLLNSVAESAANWHDDAAFDPRVQAVLRQAVAHVVRNFEQDVAVFAEGNAQVDAQIQAQSRTAELQERRHVEAARGKERLEAAKLRGGALMREIIGDQRLPRFSRALLDQAWADVLTLTLLRHGERSDEFLQQLAATRRIVDAAVHADTPPDGALLAHVETALGQVGYHGDEASVIAQRLTSHRADDEDDTASRTELAMKLKARTRLGEDAERARRPAPPPRTPDEQVQYEHLRTLPFGTWIEFTTNQQGDVVRRRMSWYSPITDHVLFVNQRGQRADEQSLDAVSRLLASGNARVVTEDRGHLVDRAWQAAMSALRSFAGRSEATPSGAPA
ncbi:MAG: DUF1631 family protein [Xanthomonas sp.]